MTKAELNLAVLEGLVLGTGEHDSWNKGACVMEAVSYVAGEPWSAHPKCACPVITSYAIALNDSMPDELRQRLVPLIPKMVGTRGDAATEARRANLIDHWYLHEHLPRLLRHAKLDEHAGKLEALPPITESTMQQAVDVLEAAGAAWDAWDAWDAWAARDARDACFDLTAKARAEEQGVKLSSETIEQIMAPVVEELWLDQVVLLERLIAL